MSSNTCPQGLPAAPAHLPAVAHCRKIPCGRNESNHTPITPNTRPQWLPAAPAHSPAEVLRREIPCGRNESNHTPITSNTCPQGLTAEKSPATEIKIIECDQPQTLARGGSPPLRCGGSPFLFPHGGGSCRKPRFESVVKRGGVAVTDDFGNLFDRIIGTAEQSRGVIEFQVVHDVGKSFSE